MKRKTNNRLVPRRTMMDFPPPNPLPLRTGMAYGQTVSLKQGIYGWGRLPDGTDGWGTIEPPGTQGYYVGERIDPVHGVVSVIKLTSRVALLKPDEYLIVTEEKE